MESHGFDDETKVICCGLTDNGIGDDGTMALAQSLEHNTTLTALYLDGLPPKTHVLLVSLQMLFFMDCDCSGNEISDDNKRVLVSITNKDTLTVLSI